MGKALKVENKLLLIQGPPGRKIMLNHYNFTSTFTGTGKTKTCVELIKYFFDLNYNKTFLTGPTILYCAPSNKAVNVGACKIMTNHCCSGSTICTYVLNVDPC